MATTLNIIGAGKLGRSLGRLWQQSGSFVIGSVMNRSRDSAEQACSFIGAGRPCTEISALQPATTWLIATPDDHIASTCEHLAGSGLLAPGSVVFHCSGALPAAMLAPASTGGASIASIHPIRSFALPIRELQDFAGTWCGAEGVAEEASGIFSRQSQ